MRITSRLAVFSALTGLLAACSDGAGPAPSTQVTFNLASGRPAAASIALLSDTIASATDTIVLDSVQLVLRDIKFKRVGEDLCDGEHEDTMPSAALLTRTDGGHEDGGENDGHDGHSDACESFRTGPFLLNVPLDSSVSKAFSVAVDTGTYDQVRTRIHKLSSDSADVREAALLAAHPELQGVSIRVIGTFNGTPFTFTSDLSAEQRLALLPPLVVADSVTNVDITIKVDVSNWFSNGAGGLVDPATANKGGANDSLVKDNIRDSFHAFRDEDRDGEDDEHEGHH